VLSKKLIKYKTTVYNYHCEPINNFVVNGLVVHNCDEGYERPCGQCGCDCSRRFAFMKAGFVDHQEYLDDEYFYKVFLPEYEKRKGEIKFRYE